MTRTLQIFAVLALTLSATLVRAGPPPAPQVTAVTGTSVEMVDRGKPVRLVPGNRAGAWTLMAMTADPSGKLRAVFEDFSSLHGGMIVVDAEGHRQDFPKSLEPTFVDPKTLYRGHSLAEVVQSDHDLLGAEILASGNDPEFADVAACLAPIAKLDVFSFVGTPGCPDKVGVTVGGKTDNFDPAVLVPAINANRASGKVLDGLVGGWLPVLRFVFPESDSSWTELLVFAPLHADNTNPRIQPVWYRVCRVEGDELKWARYVDSYPPVPPRSDGPPAAGFYRDLLTLRAGWEDALAPGMQVDLPDRRLADQARHSLVRAMMTRIDSFPKYGVMDRNYGGSEHDGFQDTFNVDVTAMQGWGLFGLARAYIDNYFTYFVRDDGSILYRGPETGQYGRMLTVVAEYFRYTGDRALLLKHRARIDAVAKLLLALREKARALPHANPGFGLIAGWSEADSCLEPEPARYVVPYFSNSSEAVRGFSDLGAVWESIGRAERRGELTEWGAALRRTSRELDADLQSALGRSRLNTTPACLPAVAGATEPFDVAAARDSHDPQFRAYRAYTEMLYSGDLARADVDAIVRYREAHRDILLGVPAAYGYDSREMGGFLSYGHAYGLLQHDFVREYLLELYSLSAHQYTRGTWTAPETRRINPADPAAPYCVPAQLTVPLLLRWMLVFEDPNADTLWLCRAAPRAWFQAGSTVAASAVPTRWGRVDLKIQSHLDQGRIDVALRLPASDSPRDTKLRLRAPGRRAISAITLNGKPWDKFDVETETITLPAVISGEVELGVSYK